MSTGIPTNDKRPYDATRRRERAEAERAATRRRVVDAAARLFLSRGYVATTMTGIAREAGVALQSVYAAGRSKADLLHLVTDVAVAGDDEDILYVDRPNVAAVAAMTDVHEQVRLFAMLTAATLERLAPVWLAYREAAAVDAKAAANLNAAHRRRRETFGTIVDMLDASSLRLSNDETADTAWAIGSIDVFLLLRTVLEWDADRYAEWLRRTLETALVG